MSDPESAARIVEYVEGRDGFVAAAIELIATASSALLLQSPALDRRLYGGEAIAEALKTTLLAHSRMQLRILVAEPSVAANTAPRLLELGSRLSSRVFWRRMPPAAARGSREELLVADLRSALLRRESESIAASRWSNDPAGCRDLIARFEALWQDAEPDSGVYSLGI